MTYYCVGCGCTFLGVARDFYHCRGNEVGDYERQIAEDAKREESIARMESPARREER